MIKAWPAALLLTVVIHGLAYGQGFLDSVLGSGFGMWGGTQLDQPTTDRFNSPEFYQGNINPDQAQFGQQPGAPGQQPQSQYGPPPGQYGQPQVQYEQPPAQYGPPPQGQYEQQAAPGYAPPGVPQQSYQYNYPPQNYPGAQGYEPGPPPQAPPPVSYSGPPRSQQPYGQPGPGAQGQPPLRPGQYAPQRGAPDVEQLPPGSVSITTITPDGTTYQYFPPAGEAPPPQEGVRPRAPQRPRRGPATTATKPQVPARPLAVQRDQTEATGIAMPKPVPAPSGRDPRSGWDPAVNRAPKAPTVLE